MELEQRERDRNENLKLKERQTLESVTDQIHAKEQQKLFEGEDKRIAEDYKRQAMGFDGSRRREMHKEKS